MDNRLYEVVIKHRVMAYGESPEHCEKIVRLHMGAADAEWHIKDEIADCASVNAIQTIVTNSELISEGFRDALPYSDSGETRTCGEILKDEADALEKQRSQPRI